jgi:hypothetical protein
MTTRKQLSTELLALPDGQRERIIEQYAAMMQHVRSMQSLLGSHVATDTYQPAMTAELERLEVAAQLLEAMTMGMLSVHTQRGAA